MIHFLQEPAYIRYVGVFLAILTPVVGLLTLSYRRQDRAQWMALPLFWLLALSGPLLVCLWWIFNAIENALGLDSILAMLVNLALFALASNRDARAVAHVARNGSGGDPPGEPSTKSQTE
jgi:hypothetical protein